MSMVKSFLINLSPFLLLLLYFNLVFCFFYFYVNEFNFSLYLFAVIMKRFNDGFSGGPPKRSKIGPDDVEIRILIPSKVRIPRLPQKVRMTCKCEEKNSTALRCDSRAIGE